jgi:hypothetical protein
MIAALGGVAAGIILCKFLRKEGYEDMWTVPMGVGSPVDNVQGVVAPDLGPDLTPLTTPPPATYAPGADFLLMDSALDMSTSAPFNPIAPFA